MTQKQNISDQDNKAKIHFLLCRYGNGLALRQIFGQRTPQQSEENTR